MQFHDHDQFPKSNHQESPPSSQGGGIGERGLGILAVLARPESRDETKWGIFAAHFWGELRQATAPS